VTEEGWRFVGTGGKIKSVFGSSMRKKGEGKKNPQTTRGSFRPDGKCEGGAQPPLSNDAKREGKGMYIGERKERKKSIPRKKRRE